MAVEKAAPIPNLIAVAAAACDSLNAVVSEFSETMAATPVATIKRRLRDSKIDLPFAKDKVEVVPFKK
jgi:hypothetical protein